MHLTQHQQDMLDGKYGKGAAYAMKIQAAIGESFGAERMVPITRAHVALSNQEAPALQPQRRRKCRSAEMCASWMKNCRNILIS